MNMKRNIKITVWIIAAIILLSGFIIGGIFLKDYLYEKLIRHLRKQRFSRMTAENILQTPHLL